MTEKFGDATAQQASLDQQDIRNLGIHEASKLPPGAKHYRAYVGPPDRFDFMSSSQFALLFHLGLRDHHSVLDFGCGSLRLGRLLIPFLQPNRYHGIDPNSWLISDAIDRELGEDAVRLKSPLFSFNDDFRCGVFGRRFDFIIAQSVLTHCGADLGNRLLRELSGALEVHGLALFSIVESPSPHYMPTAPGWTYPACVGYGRLAIMQMCRAVGLVSRAIPWYLPPSQTALLMGGADTWYIASKDAQFLPSDEDALYLHGRALFNSPPIKSTADD